MANYSIIKRKVNKIAKPLGFSIYDGEHFYFKNEKNKNKTDYINLFFTTDEFNYVLSIENGAFKYIKKLDDDYIYYLDEPIDDLDVIYFINKLKEIL